MMTKNISAYAIIVSVLCLLSSCLGDQDATTVVTYDDAVITTFTLGTFKVAKTYTNSAGHDTTTYTSVTGSTYPVVIDQLASGYVDEHKYDGTIYNTDSLPMGAQMQMIATVATKNSGVTGYQKWTDCPDSVSQWKSYSSSDTIDFSTPLRFRVISDNGWVYSDYYVNITKHTEPADTFLLETLKESSPLLSEDIFKGIATSTGMFYVLTDNGLFYTKDPAGDWTFDSSVTGNSIIAMDDTVYVYNSDKHGIYVKSTGKSAVMRQVTSSLQINTLAGTCLDEMYAISTDNRFAVSKDYGVTWQTDELELYSDEKYTPVQDICYSVQTPEVNPSIRIITVIGNMADNVEPDDTCAVIWNKTLKDDGTVIDPWTLTINDHRNKYMLPRLKHLSSCSYNKTWLMAIGGNRETGYYDDVYLSCQGDNGITWFTSDPVKIPEDGLCSESLVMSDYEGKYYYFIEPEDGSISRGRLTDASWTDYNRTVSAKRVGQLK